MDENAAGKHQETRLYDQFRCFDENHRLLLNGGIVVKTSRFERYFKRVLFFIIAITMGMELDENTYIGAAEKAANEVAGTSYMAMLGVVEIFLFRTPNFDQILWLSMVFTVMSFTYYTIGQAENYFADAEDGNIEEKVTGIMTKTQKTWKSFQALGAVALACLYSYVLIEIEDTLKAPPAQSKTFSKTIFISVLTTTIVYIFRGCFKYSKYSDMSPGNFFTKFGLYNLGNILIRFGFYNLRILVTNFGFYNLGNILAYIGPYNHDSLVTLFVTRHVINAIYLGMG